MGSVVGRGMISLGSLGFLFLDLVDISAGSTLSFCFFTFSFQELDVLHMLVLIRWV